MIHKCLVVTNRSILVLDMIAPKTLIIIGMVIILSSCATYDCPFDTSFT